MKITSLIQNVFLTEDLMDDTYVREILERLGKEPVLLPPGGRPPLPLAPWSEILSWGKKTLFITKFPGRFFRPCPGTKAYLCCGYQIFHIGQGCPLDCTYCILQAYLNSPWLTFFANVLEEGLRELKEVLLKKQGFIRVGTGEFTDSLALDPITRLNARLIPLFSASENAVLELKTKTSHIEHLQGLVHNRKTILAWSLNTKRMAKAEEQGAATVEERIFAARKATSWGYPVAFHFDPLIHYPGWLEEYTEVLKLIFHEIPEENIAWISLGTLRYMPKLKEIALERFPKTKIFSDEFILGLDGKKRYVRPLRVELYRGIYQAIRDLAPKVCVYLCMESPEVWEEALGFSPLTKGGLPHMLDEAARKVINAL